MTPASYRSALGNAGVGYVPLYANRRQSAGFSQTIWFEGIDLTGSAFKAQVRQYPDASGDPTAELTIGTPGVVDGDTGIALTLSHALLEALPASPTAEAGENVEFYWDLWVDGVVTLAGEFVVVGGVTDNG